MVILAALEGDLTADLCNVEEQEKFFLMSACCLPGSLYSTVYHVYVYNCQTATIYNCNLCHKNGNFGLICYSKRTNQLLYRSELYAMPNIEGAVLDSMWT